MRLHHRGLRSHRRVPRAHRVPLKDSRLLSTWRSSEPSWSISSLDEVMRVHSLPEGTPLTDSAQMPEAASIPRSATRLYDGKYSFKYLLHYSPCISTLLPPFLSFTDLANEPSGSPCVSDALTHALHDTDKPLSGL